MFEANPQGPSNLPIYLSYITPVERPCSSPNPRLISEYLDNGRPFIWDLAVCMTIFRVIHIWIDTALKHLVVETWVCWCVASSSGKMDVEEGRDVT